MDLSYLRHFGVMSMKWGVRKYQNADGSLTSAGKRRYDSDGTPKKTGASSKAMASKVKPPASTKKSTVSKPSAKKSAPTTKKPAAKKKAAVPEPKKRSIAREMVQDVLDNAAKRSFADFVGAPLFSNPIEASLYESVRWAELDAFTDRNMGIRFKR